MNSVLFTARKSVIILATAGHGSVCPVAVLSRLELLSSRVNNIWNSLLLVISCPSQSVEVLTSATIFSALLSVFGWKSWGSIGVYECACLLNYLLHQTLNCRCVPERQQAAFIGDRGAAPGVCQVMEDCT